MAHGKALLSSLAYFILWFGSSFAPAESFSDYQSAKLKIQSLIGNAQTSVYLRSKLMTDGDLVMSLFVAKYRGIDTKVVVASATANQYLSRYRDLMKQGIPTSPKTGSWSSPTSLIIDGKLYELNVPLDFRVQSKSFDISEGNEKQKNLVMDDFTLPEKFKTTPASPLPSPKLQKPPTTAGKPSSVATADSLQVDESSSPNKPVSSVEDGNGYRYKNRKFAVPQGVDTKLPRKPKYQLKSAQPPNSEH